VPKQGNFYTYFSIKSVTLTTTRRINLFGIPAALIVTVFVHVGFSIDMDVTLY